VLLAWAAVVALVPPPAEAGGEFRLLQGLALLIGLGVSWLSYAAWVTPPQLARDKLGAETWIRYAALDMDNVVGEQTRRDKERLVEYRSLNRR
jgi:hypothetical protein